MNVIIKSLCPPSDCLCQVPLHSSEPWTNIPSVRKFYSTLMSVEKPCSIVLVVLNFIRSVIKTWRARKLRCSCTYRWMMRYCVEINLGEQRIFKIISFYVRRVYSKPRSCPRRRSLTTAAHSITSGTGNVAMAWTISCMHFEIPRYAIRNKWFLLSRKEGLWEKWNIKTESDFSCNCVSERFCVDCDSASEV